LTHFKMNRKINSFRNIREDHRIFQMSN